MMTTLSCPTCEEPMIEQGASDVVNTFRYRCPSCGTTTEITYAQTGSDEIKDLADLVQRMREDEKE